MRFTVPFHLLPSIPLTNSDSILKTRHYYIEMAGLCHTQLKSILDYYQSTHLGTISQVHLIRPNSPAVLHTSLSSAPLFFVSVFASVIPLDAPLSPTPSSPFLCVS